MLLLYTLIHDCRKDLAKKIKELQKYLKQKNIFIEIEEYTDENVCFINIYSKYNDFNSKEYKLFNLYIANIIYDEIIEEYCNCKLKGFLLDTYFFLKPNEIKEISNLAVNVFKNDDFIIEDDKLYFINKRNKIVKKILQCFIENNKFNIEGFITFRTKEINSDLENMVDKLIEDYMIEKEYNEFIKLLKYFVELEESKINEVNIIITDSGEYIIKDEKGEDVTFNLLEGINYKDFSNSINFDDALISMLITSSPKKIIIHHSEKCINRELLNTIVKVFENRVDFCGKCKLCENSTQYIKI